MKADRLKRKSLFLEQLELTRGRILGLSKLRWLTGGALVTTAGWLGLVSRSLTPWAAWPLIGGGLFLGALAPALARRRDRTDARIESKFGPIRVLDMELTAPEEHRTRGNAPEEAMGEMARLNAEAGPKFLRVSSALVLLLLVNSLAAYHLGYQLNERNRSRGQAMLKPHSTLEPLTAALIAAEGPRQQANPEGHAFVQVAAAQRVRDMTAKLNEVIHQDVPKAVYYQSRGDTPARERQAGEAQRKLQEVRQAIVAFESTGLSKKMAGDVKDVLGKIDDHDKQLDRLRQGRADTSELDRSSGALIQATKSLLKAIEDLILNLIRFLEDILGKLPNWLADLGLGLLGQAIQGNVNDGDLRKFVEGLEAEFSKNPPNLEFVRRDGLDDPTDAKVPPAPWAEAPPSTNRPGGPVRRTDWEGGAAKTDENPGGEQKGSPTLPVPK
jgi:hypothetical protein